MWQCPFCGNVYYSSNQVGCNCHLWVKSTMKGFYEPPVIGEDIDTEKMEHSISTLVVNLFAGPGAGKSTMCAGIFTELKWKGIECEIASEYAKDLVWEGRSDTFLDQIYIFGKQYHRVFRLLGQVEVVITDCPILLTPIYDKEKRASLEQLVVVEHRKMRTYNVFIKRTKPYRDKGRIHTKQEAQQIDRSVLDMLDKYDIPFEVFEGSPDGLAGVVKKILMLIKYGKEK